MLWTSSPGPITSKNRGTISTWTPTSPSSRMSGTRSSWRIVGEREDDPIDVEFGDEVAQVLGSAEDGGIAETVVVPSRGSRIDEAEDVDAVLRVLEELARDELADLAGADDRPRSGGSCRAACRAHGRRSGKG